ncbi:hypothetical protein AB0D66_31550, partial [Streptomyces sp. NPDC048270]|uniref:hypothetical protein n=1 Tax=Streptomyces sp. NPDC048270 TaxID=3154615 RepID=UPI00340A6518
NPDNSQEPAKEVYMSVLCGFLTRSQADETLTQIATEATSKIPPPQIATTDLEIKETTVPASSMRFLKVAAIGDWELAAIAANREMPSRKWGKETLQNFVHSLAPGDQRDAQVIADEMFAWFKANLLTAERSLQTVEEWRWLALRANGNLDEAVAEASSALQWPECSIRWLDYFIYRLQHNPDNSQEPAKEVYMSVLCGFLTRSQADETLTRIRTQYPAEIRQQEPQAATFMSDFDAMALGMSTTVSSKRVRQQSATDALTDAANKIEALRGKMNINTENKRILKNLPVGQTVSAVIVRDRVALEGAGTVYSDAKRLLESATPWPNVGKVMGLEITTFNIRMKQKGSFLDPGEIEIFDYAQGREVAIQRALYPNVTKKAVTTKKYRQ